MTSELVMQHLIGSFIAYESSQRFPFAHMERAALSVGDTRILGGVNGRRMEKNARMNRRVGKARRIAD
jgi:hypothetical protein